MSNDSETLFKINSVSYSYGSEEALGEISTEIKAGKFYGIIGPNGCGKTTFLDLLTGSRIPPKGNILLHGKPLTSYGKRDLARKLALVPQEYDTGFGYRVEELVMMGRHPHINRFASPGDDDWRAVDKALASIGIAGLKDRYANTLSGGQKQRAVVARALAQESPVLLFDEATSSLDIKYTLQIFSIVKDLVRSGQRTVIAVIHDLNMAAAYCDEILFMQNGTIAFQGKTAEIINAENIKTVFNVSSRVDRDAYSNSLRISFRYQEEAKQT